MMQNEHDEKSKKTAKDKRALQRKMELGPKDHCVRFTGEYRKCGISYDEMKSRLDLFCDMEHFYYGEQESILILKSDALCDYFLDL